MTRIPATRLHQTRANQFAVLFSTVMTYLMAPAVPGLLRRWLYPRRPAQDGD